MQIQMFMNTVTQLMHNEAQCKLMYILIYIDFYGQYAQAINISRQMQVS